MTTDLGQRLEFEELLAEPEGMILTSGGRFAGYGLYLLQGKPVFLWNLVDLERIRWEGASAAPAPAR